MELSSGIERKPHHNEYETPDHGKIFAASSGWVAEYETFDIEDKAKSRRAVLIDIDQMEISTLLEQSLKCSPLGFWRCAFPMHISHDLSIFIMLRTVVVTISNDANHDTLSYITQHIPTDYHSRLSRRWSKLRLLSDMSYTYETALSANNQFLLLADKDFNELEDVSVVAVFQMRLSITEISLEGIAITMAKFSPSIQNCSFHPFEAMLVFIHEYDVFSWEFLEG
jgi:hypothetical protein